MRTLLLPILLVILSPALTVAAEPGGRPLNVVFVIADDLGWGELSCYGQERFKTPHIDRLATEGMRFTQHYSGAPTCAPSRCVLMTGKDLGNAEVRGNMQAEKNFPQFKEGQHPLSESARTFLQEFQQAGYATGAMGKWGLGPVGSTGDPNKKGLDLFFGYNCQAVAHSYYPEFLWRNAERVKINERPVPGHMPRVEGEVRLEDYTSENYAPSLMIDEALKFIDANKSKPFFLYLPFTQPHVAMHPPRESVERFPEEWDEHPYRGGQGYLPHPRPRAAYAAMITELDDYVGLVMGALEAAGIADNTLVVFTSDNGTTHRRNKNARFHVGGVDAEFFNSTRGLRGFKGEVYEGGIRVPMIARLPGVIPAGKESDFPGYFADWYPTLCEAAGLDVPEGLDGQSLWKVLTDDPLPQARKGMVWAFTEYGGQVAWRIGPYKVIRTGLKTENPSPWELYDIANDPGENRNLAEEMPELIDMAKEVFKNVVSENEVFPLTIPGVNAPED